MKWDGAIIPFHVPFWVIQLDFSFGKKVGTQDDDLFDIIIVKHQNLLLADAPVFINLRQFLVSHRDNFLSVKLTCEGPHKFGITK